MTAAEVLGRIITALEGAGVRYMLTGSFASAHYGAARSTLDIDLVIAANPEQLSRFVQSLPSREYYVDLEAALEAHRHESLFNVIDDKTGWKIDLIIRKSRPFSLEEFSRRQLVSVQGLSIFVASVEDVIVAKLEWAKRTHSQRQLEDVGSILKLQWEGLDQSYLEKWIAELELTQHWVNAKRIAGVSSPS